MISLRRDGERWFHHFRGLRGPGEAPLLLRPEFLRDSGALHHKRFLSRIIVDMGRNAQTAPAFSLKEISRSGSRLARLENCADPMISWRREAARALEPPAAEWYNIGQHKWKGVLNAEFLETAGHFGADVVPAGTDFFGADRKFL